MVRDRLCLGGPSHSAGRKDMSVKDGVVGIGEEVGECGEKCCVFMRRVVNVKQSGERR